MDENLTWCLGGLGSQVSPWSRCRRNLVSSLHHVSARVGCVSVASCREICKSSACCGQMCHRVLFFFLIHPPSCLTLVLFFFLTLGLFVCLFIYLFIYLWLCWVFVSVRGLSLVAASGGHSSLRCAGLSLSRPLLLRSTGSRRAGSVVVAHGPSCSAAYGILPDQGSNPCPLHWQADPQPLCHQGSPCHRVLISQQNQLLRFFFFSMSFLETLPISTADSVPFPPPP